MVPREFNSYGSRRGNDNIMARGTFANIRLVNKFIGKAAPKTIHLPSAEKMDVFDAAEKYRAEGRHLIVLSGKDYGSGRTPAKCRMVLHQYRISILTQTRRFKSRLGCQRSLPPGRARRDC